MTTDRQSGLRAKTVIWGSILPRLSSTFLILCAAVMFTPAYAAGQAQSDAGAVANTTGVIVYPEKLNWGTVQVGVTSAQLNVKLTNAMAAALPITSIKITGTDKGDFAETSTGCGTSLPGGASCYITVTFSPAATGSLTGDVTIKDNNGSTQTVSLSGTGADLTAGTLAVTVSPGLPSGTNAAYTVTSSNGYQSPTMTGSYTFSGLAPGTYNTVASVVTSSSSSDTVYVPTVTGASTVVTATGGAAATVSYSELVTTKWKALGPSSIGGSALSAAGKLQAFAQSGSNHLLMYAAGSTQPWTSYSETGVYKSTNGGTSWSQKNNGLTDPTVNALWMDPSNTDTVVAGTNSGIFRTTNGGSSWTLRSSNLASVLAFSYVNGTLSAATSTGIATSTNNGASWNLPNPTWTSGVQALAQRGGYTYAGLANGDVMILPPAGQWLTTTPIPTIYGVMSIAIDPGRPKIAYVVEWLWYQSPDLYETTTAGKGSAESAPWFVPTASAPYCPLGSPTGQQAQALAFETITADLYAGCDGYSNNGTESPLFELPNNGTSWEEVTTDNGAWDIRSIATDVEKTEGDMVVASDQGLYFFNNSNSNPSWSSLNGNITSSLLFSVGISDETIFTTAQDFGLIYSFDDGTSWATGASILTEGGTILFNPVNPAYLYTFTGSGSGFQYSENGGQSFTPAAALPGSEFVNADSIAVDPNNASTLYVAGSSGFFQSTNWGVEWNPESWSFGSAPYIPQTIAVSPANSQSIFVGTCTIVDGICNTYTGGAVWYWNLATNQWDQSVLPAGTCGLPTSIAIDPANAQIVLVAMSEASSCGGVLRSTNGGANFSASNTVLTGRQAQCNSTDEIPYLRVDPGSSGAVAVATPNGVYISTDFGVNWTGIRGNTVPLSASEAIWSGGYLYESTCGQGLLRIYFPF
jgi:hypothetical protein